MLRDSFFKLGGIVRGEESVVVNVTLNRSHSIYSAHFPGHPITPGVCIVRMAVEILSLLEGRELSLKGARNIKFLVPIDPTRTQSLDFEVKGRSVVVREATPSGETPLVFAKMNLELE